jgi:two-component system nitrate/nitrite response regulator NarL
MVLMLPSLSIIIVDDHPLFLKGMSYYLEKQPFIRSVKTCLSRECLFQELSLEVPDAIFLDLNIPPHHGLTICQEVLAKYPDIRIFIITNYDIAGFILKAQKIGAGAYFIKDVDPQIVIDFLSNVAQGNIKGFFCHVPSVITSKLPFEKDSFELRELLTVREREILEMIILRITHNEIENKLHISNSTYKGHRANIYQKLMLDDDFDLALFAIKHGLYPL